MNKRQKLAIVLADNRPGNNNQAQAVAKEITNNVVTITLDYNFLINLPNFIRQKFSSPKLAGFTSESFKQLTTLKKQPDFIVSAGRRLAWANIYLKQQYQKCFNIHLMRPGLKHNLFDLLIIPEHDNPKEASNVMTMMGSPSIEDTALYDESIKHWQPSWPKDKNKTIAILIGGNSRQAQFDNGVFAQQISALVQYADAHNYHIVAVTSRRTNYEQIAILQHVFDGTHQLHFYHPSNTEPNIYYAMLKLAPIIAVTGDSVGMVSEAINQLHSIPILLLPTRYTNKLSDFFCKIDDREYATLMSNNKEFEYITNIITKKYKKPEPWNKILKQKLKELGQ
ncbi:MAG: ELM1/GtrOC1 family putative glycosyltransferase [Pseudomonadota bacterium]